MEYILEYIATLSAFASMISGLIMKDTEILQLPLMIFFSSTLILFVVCAIASLIIISRR